MQKIFILEAKRTAIGNFSGTISGIKPQEYSAALIKNILLKHKNLKDNINKVIIGHVLQCGLGQNPARQAAMLAGLNYKIPSFIVNQLCGSGLKAVILGHHELQDTDNEFIFAGGQENMSLSPHFLNLRNKNIKLGNLTFSDSLIVDGLTDVFENYHMGITAENLATKYSITRLEQDQYTLDSQKKAMFATHNGYFKNEIVPIEIKNQKNIIHDLFDKDEFIKENTTIDILQKLKPAFLPNNEGTVTAGNSSGINDGASILLLANENSIKKYNLQPLAEIISFAEIGVEPKFMGIAPVEACKLAIKKAKWTLSEIDLIEINEAFASQVLSVIKELNIDIKKLNINGGAIALGHPIGASGARCLTTLIHSMKKEKAEKGLVSLCVGGGMGIAMCVKNIN
jgi:acetyl-CoA C-acetyltransferase